MYRDSPSWTPLGDAAQARRRARCGPPAPCVGQLPAPQRSTHLLVARDDLLRAADPLPLFKPGWVTDRVGGLPSRQDWEHDLQRAVLPWHAGWRAPGGRAVACGRTTTGTSPICSGTATAIRASSRPCSMSAWRRRPVPCSTWPPRLSATRWPGWMQAARRRARAISRWPCWPATARSAAVCRAVHLLADLLPVVQLDFALSEVEYFEGVTRSPANADVAYHTFLLGHADWFSTPAGRACWRRCTPLPERQARKSVRFVVK